MTTACNICQKPFAPQRMGQVVCGYACAKKVPAMARKTAAKAIRARKEAVKSRSEWLKEAQQAFNAWIRARDAGEGCVSCGYHWHGNFAGNLGMRKANAGHYLSTAARPELRFHEHNCNLQCEQCNTYLSGNLIPYRAELIRRIGLPAVESLEGPHVSLKLTVDDLKAIKADYRARLKAMQQTA